MMVKELMMILENIPEDYQIRDVSYEPNEDGELEACGDKPIRAVCVYDDWNEIYFSTEVDHLDDLPSNGYGLVIDYNPTVKKIS